MQEEYNALLQNNTWQLVPRPPNTNIVSGKWIFRQKFHSDGSLSRYKARWVCRGFSQQQGIYYEENFSPVVKPSTIRTVLSVGVSSSWPIHQLDVKNFRVENQAKTENLGHGKSVVTEMKIKVFFDSAMTRVEKEEFLAHTLHVSTVYQTIKAAVKIYVELGE